jgi:dimethylargininase
MTAESPTFRAPFVRTDSTALRGVLVAAPTGAIATVAPVFGEAHAIADRAADQFAILIGRLGAAGVKVTTLELDAATTFGWACADGAVVFEDGAFLMRPSDVRRRPEIAVLEQALERAGVPVVGRVEAPGLLDGGDVLVAGDTIYIGYPHARQAEIGIPAARHGNALGREQLAAYARSKQIKVVEVALAAEVTRLRAVASLVDAHTVVLGSGLLDATAFAGLEIIVAPRGEDYGAGVLPLGNRRVIANLRFRETIPLLRKSKIGVDAIDLWEFGKVGVTPALLALALKRG